MGGWEIILKVFLLFKAFEGVAEETPVARRCVRRRGARTAEKTKSANEKGREPVVIGARNKARSKISNSKIFWWVGARYSWSLERLFYRGLGATLQYSEVVDDFAEVEVSRNSETLQVSCCGP